VDDIVYTVTNVKTTDKIGESLMDTFFGAEADGIFYVISLKVENKGKESKNIFTPRFKIIDNKGRSYDPDTEAEIYEVVTTNTLLILVINYNLDCL